MNRQTQSTWLAIACGWAAMVLFVSLFRPLMPVDETRYMSVAWEMLVRDTWLLPSLNYEPYSHKPPMLFWLIRTGWAVFGIGETPVRVILGLFILALFGLTARLARALFPAQASLPAHSMLMLAALPVFLIYASMIMFDSLLAVFVLAGLLCIWQARETTGFKPWLWLGVALGLGILAKGPVALVYTLPAALLAPLWHKRDAWRGWYGRILLAVGIGAAIALCWAIPAAISGGEAYAQKIFLKQSAGRMVNAFDHREPFWFYIPVVLGFLAPLLALPAFWRTLPKTAIFKDAPVRFLLCQIIPVFLFFSLISSKQIHYMLPLMPACAILAAYLLDRGLKQAGILLPLALSALPSLIFLAMRAGGLTIKGLEPVMGGFLVTIALIHVGAVAALWLFSKKQPAYNFEVLAGAAFLLFAFMHMQLGQSFFPRYDFSPLRPVLEQFKDNPVAVVPKYDGEYGYELRLTKPVTIFEDGLNDAWLTKHRDTVVIWRGKNSTAHEPMYYYILRSQPFRASNRIDIMLYKLRPYEKDYWRGSRLYSDPAFMKDKE